MLLYLIKLTDKACCDTILQNSDDGVQVIIYFMVFFPSCRVKNNTRRFGDRFDSCPRAKNIFILTSGPRILDLSG
jgi:hypothetical protein